MTKRWTNVVDLLRSGSSVAGLTEALAAVEYMLAVEAPSEHSDRARRKVMQ